MAACILTAKYYALVKLTACKAKGKTCLLSTIRLLQYSKSLYKLTFIIHREDVQYVSLLANKLISLLVNYEQESNLVHGANRWNKRHNKALIKQREKCVVINNVHYALFWIFCDEQNINSIELFLCENDIECYQYKANILKRCFFFSKAWLIIQPFVLACQSVLIFIIVYTKKHIQKWDESLVDLSKKLDELKINQLITCVLSFRLLRWIWKNASLIISKCTGQLEKSEAPVNVIKIEFLIILIISRIYVCGLYYLSLIYHHARKDVLSRLTPNENQHHVELSEPTSCTESPVSRDVSINKIMILNNQHGVIIKDLKGLEEINEALSLKIRSKKQDYHLKTSRNIDTLFQYMGLEIIVKTLILKIQSQDNKESNYNNKYSIQEQKSSKIKSPN